MSIWKKKSRVVLFRPVVFREAPYPQTLTHNVMYREPVPQSILSNWSTGVRWSFCVMLRICCLHLGLGFQCAETSHVAIARGEAFVYVEGQKSKMVLPEFVRGLRKRRQAGASQRHARW